MIKIISFEKVVKSNTYSNVFYIDLKGKLFKCRGTKKFIDRRFVIETNNLREVKYGCLAWPKETKELFRKYNIPIFHHRHKEEFLSNLKEVDTNGKL